MVKMSGNLPSLNKWVGRIRSLNIYPPIALIALALLLRMLWIVYTDFSYEDSFITFRYAHQIVEGNGFVYNPGERVYGTTTPLFTLLLAGWEGRRPSDEAPWPFSNRLQRPGGTLSWPCHGARAAHSHCTGPARFFLCHLLIGLWTCASQA